MNSESDPAYTAHVKYMARQQDDLRDVLDDVRAKTAAAIDAYREFYTAGCGSDCCLGYTEHQAAKSLLEDALRNVVAARALTRTDA